MNLIKIFDTGFHQIPNELSLKSEGYDLIFGVLLIISIVLIAIAKRNNEKVFAILFKLFFATSNIEQKIKESYHIFSLSSILLLVNYLLMMSCLLFLSNYYLALYPNWFVSLVSFGLPLFMFILQITPVFLMNFFSDAKLNLFVITGTSFVVFQVTGLLLNLLLIVWILNPTHGLTFIYIFLSIVVLMHFIRFVKNSLVVLSTSVSWYYILLYFCTLEILPLFVVFYYLRANFL